MSQAEPDAAAVAAAVEDIAESWAQMARRWPWMRQQSLRPVYILAGELLQALVRAYPAMLRSNQWRWYARAVHDTPSIYVLFPDLFREEAQKRLGGSDPHALEGKQVISFLYLAGIDGQTQAAKTLLATTEMHAPMFRAQLAHELLNCATATEYDGTELRAGCRSVIFGAGGPVQSGANLSDLLIDTLLFPFLPTATAYTAASLLEGVQGPYWHIAQALGRKLPQEAVLGALFGARSEVDALAGLLNEAFERGDAALWLDRLIADRQWDDLATALGSE
jgi:hypothetical protein